MFSPTALWTAFKNYAHKSFKFKVVTSAMYEYMTF